MTLSKVRIGPLPKKLDLPLRGMKAKVEYHIPLRGMKAKVEYHIPLRGMKAKVKYHSRAAECGSR